MKTLMVPSMNEAEVFKRLKNEQKFKPTMHDSPRLVDKSEMVTEEGQLFSSAQYCLPCCLT